MKIWFLLILWTSQDITVREMENELACDSHRIAVMRLTVAADYQTEPKPVAVACVLAEVER